MRRTAVRATAVLASLALGLAACGGEEPATGAAPSSATAPPSASASAEPPAGGPGDDAEARVAAALEALDRREEIAQLFVVGVPADALGSGAGLVEQGVGGIFLAGRPAAPAAELAELTAGWQADATGPGLWIAVDQEGGAVQTLKGPGFDRLPPATDQGDLPAGQLAELAGRLGSQLRDAGINLNLAPVVDVVPAGTEDTNGPIGVFDRQYGSTGAEVTPAAGAVVDGPGGGRGHRHAQALPGSRTGPRQHRRHRRRRRPGDHRGRRPGDRVRRHAGRGRCPADGDDVLGDLRPDRPDGPGGVLPRRRAGAAARHARLHRPRHLRRPRQRRRRGGHPGGRARDPLPGRRGHAGAHRRPHDLPGHARGGRGAQRGGPGLRRDRRRRRPHRAAGQGRGRPARLTPDATVPPGSVIPAEPVGRAAPGQCPARGLSTSPWPASAPRRRTGSRSGC
ncbi:hypothetical protein JKP75_10585 [Blastococcus sp. TML/M2B]|nr:hypothetical protein [Blastococcus sp. TML/M2B]